MELFVCVHRDNSAGFQLKFESQRNGHTQDDVSKILFKSNSFISVANLLRNTLELQMCQNSQCSTLRCGTAANIDFSQWTAIALTVNANLVKLSVNDRECGNGLSIDSAIGLPTVGGLVFGNASLNSVLPFQGITEPVGVVANLRAISISTPEDVGTPSLEQAIYLGGAPSSQPDTFNGAIGLWPRSPVASKIKLRV